MQITVCRSYLHTPWIVSVGHDRLTRWQHDERGRIAGDFRGGRISHGEFIRNLLNLFMGANSRSGILLSPSFYLFHRSYECVETKLSILKSQQPAWYWYHTNIWIRVLKKLKSPSCQQVLEKYAVVRVIVRHAWESKHTPGFIGA